MVEAIPPPETGHGEGMMDDIRYEAEDVEAPNGRCHECYRPFGMPSKDGFIVYKAYSHEASICTECVRWENEQASRKYDEDQNRRRR